MNMALLKLGNRLFSHGYFLYKPLYSAYKTFSDRHERALLRAVIRPGMTIVDVGANIGIYTRFLSRCAGDTGKVYAFEPSPDNFERLKKNVQPLANTRAIQAAISDANGEIELFVSDDLNVDHRTYDSEDGRRRVTVRAYRLDDFFVPGTRIDVIKIDTQGFEYHVLSGAKRILGENRNIKILMEYWPYGLTKAHVEPASLLSFVEELGFCIQSIPGAEPSAILSPSRDRVDQYCNLFLSRSVKS